MDLLRAIGNTPLIELTRLGHLPRDVRLFGKLEGNNPGGSVKDRPAYWMIRAAEREGTLTPEKTILEPTSGNTGIALAMIGAARGYRVKLCLAASVSVERRRVLEALGATIVVTPAEERTDGAIRAAHRLIAEQPRQYYMPNQFANEANVLAHYESTGPEIYAQTDGDVSVFVAGMGTCGTLMGVGQALKERNPAIRIVGVEPVIGHGVQGLKNMNEAIRPKIYDPSQLDDKQTVSDEEAFETARRLAQQEGIFVGMSSGAAAAVGLRLARQMRRGAIVVLLPDRGDRYLSTNLFQPLPPVASARVA
jgi:cysteine synthase B